MSRNFKNAWLSLLYWKHLFINIMYYIILFSSSSWCISIIKRLWRWVKSFRHHRRYQKLSFSLFRAKLCAHAFFLITITKCNIKMFYTIWLCPSMSSHMTVEILSSNSDVKLVFRIWVFISKKNLSIFIFEYIS